MPWQTSFTNRLTQNRARFGITSTNRSGGSLTDAVIKRAIADPAWGRTYLQRRGLEDEDIDRILKNESDPGFLAKAFGWMDVLDAPFRALSINKGRAEIEDRRGDTSILEGLARNVGNAALGPIGMFKGTLWDRPENVMNPLEEAGKALRGEQAASFTSYIEDLSDEKFLSEGERDLFGNEVFQFVAGTGMDIAGSPTTYGSSGLTSATKAARAQKVAELVEGGVNAAKMADLAMDVGDFARRYGDEFAQGQRAFGSKGDEALDLLKRLQSGTVSYTELPQAARNELFDASTRWAMNSVGGTQRKVGIPFTREVLDEAGQATGKYAAGGFRPAVEKIQTDAAGTIFERMGRQPTLKTWGATGAQKTINLGKRAVDQGGLKLFGVSLLPERTIVNAAGDVITKPGLQMGVIEPLARKAWTGANSIDLYTKAKSLVNRYAEVDAFGDQMLSTYLRVRSGDLDAARQVARQLAVKRGVELGEVLDVKDANRLGARIEDVLPREAMARASELRKAKQDEVRQMDALVKKLGAYDEERIAAIRGAAAGDAAKANAKLEELATLQADAADEIASGLERLGLPQSTAEALRASAASLRGRQQGLDTALTEVQRAIKQAKSDVDKFVNRSAGLRESAKLPVFGGAETTVKATDEAVAAPVDMLTQTTSAVARPPATLDEFIEKTYSPTRLKVEADESTTRFIEDMKTWLQSHQVETAYTDAAGVPVDFTEEYMQAIGELPGYKTYRTARKGTQKVRYEAFADQLRQMGDMYGIPAISQAGDDHATVAAFGDLLRGGGRDVNLKTADDVIAAFGEDAFVDDILERARAAQDAGDMETAQAWTDFAEEFTRRMETSTFDELAQDPWAAPVAKTVETITIPKPAGWQRGETTWASDEFWSLWDAARNSDAAVKPSGGFSGVSVEDAFPELVYELRKWDKKAASDVRSWGVVPLTEGQAQQYIADARTLAAADRENRVIWVVPSRVSPMGEDDPMQLLAHEITHAALQSDATVAEDAWDIVDGVRVPRADYEVEAEAIADIIVQNLESRLSGKAAAKAAQEPKIVTQAEMPVARKPRQQRVSDVRQKLDDAYARGLVRGRREAARTAVGDAWEAAARSRKAEGREANILEKMAALGDDEARARYAYKQVSKLETEIANIKRQAAVQSDRFRRGATEYDRVERTLALIDAKRAKVEDLDAQMKAIFDEADYGRMERILIDEDGYTPERAHELRLIAEGIRDDLEMSQAAKRAVGRGEVDLLTGQGSTGYTPSMGVGEQPFFENMRRTIDEKTGGKLPVFSPEYRARAEVTEDVFGRPYSELTPAGRKHGGGQGGRSIRPKTPDGREYMTKADRIAAGIQTELDVRHTIPSKLQADADLIAKTRFEDSVIGSSGRRMEFDVEEIAERTGQSIEEVERKVVPEGWVRKRIERDSGNYDVIIPEVLDKWVKTYEDVFISSEAANTFARGFDRIQNTLKSMMTVWNPSFHARNMPSNYFLAFAQELGDPGSWIEGHRAFAAVLAGEGDKVMIHVGDATMSATELVESLRGQVIRGIGGSTDIGQATLRMIDQATPRANLLGELRRTLSPTRVGQEVGDATENAARASVYLAARNKGLTHEAAMLLPDKVLYNYMPENMTSFEREVVKRIIPFYAWLKQNLPQQIENMLKNPGRIGWLGKMRNAAFDATDIDPMLLPEWMRDLGMMPLPAGEGEENLMWNPSQVPWQDLQRLGAGSKELAGMVSPVIKSPFELMANYDFYRQRDIEGYEYEGERAPGYLTLADNIMSAIGSEPWEALKEKAHITYRVDDKTGEKYLAVPGKLRKAMRDFMPFAENVGRMVGERPAEYDARSKDTFNALAYATGIRLSPMDEDYYSDQQVRRLRSAIGDELQRLRDEGKL